LGLFPVLGIPAQLGRTLMASDDEEGPRNVAVLSDRLWRRGYHADPGVIGRGVTISDEAYTIVGVMPPDFEFRYADAELWTPLRLTPTSPWLQVAARLMQASRLHKPEALWKLWRIKWNRKGPKIVPVKIAVTPWRDMPDQKYKLTLIFVLAAVGLVI
jgi:hypothetical protein